MANPMVQIAGSFRIESDAAGSFYQVTFTPDAPQGWSVQPEGISFRFMNFSVTDLIGGHCHRELAAARSSGVAEFHGHVLREKYASYARARGVPLGSVA
jgi:hypothetical protein